MAIYHLNVKTISRSAGRSATAAAAYRAGVEIEDQRSGEIHDYRRRSGVESAELFVPDDAPAWAQDRAALWNAAEQSETRKNSTVAREVVVALPAELDAQERRDLAGDLARALVERHRCAVDVAIHSPGRKGDDRNHHAHLLMSTRRLEPEGFTVKTRELDQAKNKEVPYWRERWAQLANSALERAGRAERIDHRSLREQGIEREPTKHLGPGATAAERDQGTPSRRRQAHEVEAAARVAGVQELGALDRSAAAVAMAIERTQIDAAAEREARDQRLEALRADRLAAYGQPAALETPAAAAPAVPAAQLHQEEPKAPADWLAPFMERLEARRAALDEPAAPAVPKETKMQAMDRRAIEAIEKGPPGTAERRYDNAIEGTAKNYRAERAKAIEALDEERRQSNAQRLAHLQDKPGRVSWPGKMETWKQAGEALDKAAADLKQRESAAAKSIEPETVAAIAKTLVAKHLPRLTERAAVERQAREAAEREQERQAHAKRVRDLEKQDADRAKARVAKDFASMAVKRESKSFGFTDRSEKWQELPAELKEQIERYNRLPRDKRPVELERIAADPAMPELVKRSRDRGMER
jgi:hypothetical protein